MLREYDTSVVVDSSSTKKKKKVDIHIFLIIYATSTYANPMNIVDDNRDMELKYTEHFTLRTRCMHLTLSFAEHTKEHDPLVDMASLAHGCQRRQMLVAYVLVTDA